MPRRISATLLLVLSISTPSPAEEGPAKHPLSQERRTALRKQFDDAIAELTEAIQDDPENVDHYSRRGDARFFRGEFKKAVADYEKMVELNPKLDASHWRRGIAYFYAGDFRKAARQFEIYHTFDNVDRENGIWRYFSQRKAYGRKRARKELLKYEKDDREPFPAVYKLFEGRMTPEEILSGIRSAEISATEREKRFFYARLYVGLNLALEGKRDAAREQLYHAVANTWAPRAGFGPRYMWHVGRLHYERLATEGDASGEER